MEIIKLLESSIKNNSFTFFHAPTGFGKTYNSIKLMKNLGYKTIIFINRRSQFSVFLKYIFRELKLIPKVYLSKGVGCIKYNLDEEDSNLIDCSNCSFKIFNNKFLDLVKAIFERNYFDLMYLKEFFKYYRICPSFLLRSIKSNIEILTNFWIIEDNLYNLIRDKLSRINFVIFDEYHSLVSNFINYYSISVNYINKAYEEINKIENYNCRELLEDFLFEFKYLIDNKEFLKLKDISKKYNIKILESCIKELIYKENKIYINKIIRLIEKINNLNNFILIYEDNRINIFRFDINNLIKRLKLVNRALFLSATGLDEKLLDKLFINYKIINIEDDIYKKYNFYISESLTSKYNERNESLYEEYANIIKYIINKSKKIVLVFFVSYEFLKEVKKYFKEDDNISEDDDIQTLVNKIKNKKIKAIFSVFGGKLNESIDFIVNNENVISDVVLVGIPYLNPELVKKINENTNLGKEINNFLAYVKVRQAIGRARASEKKKVNVWLLDYRYLEDYWVNKLKLQETKLEII